MLRLRVAQVITGQSPSTDTVDRPGLNYRAVGLQRFEQHAIGMKIQEHFGFPGDLQRSYRFQYRFNRHIGHVAATRRGQTAVKRYPKAVYLAVTCQKHFSRPFRPHRVAARRPVANPEYLFDRFHLSVNGLFGSYVHSSIRSLP